MIVLKHNGTVYIALSCWTMRDPEARKSGVPDLENISVWHPGRKKNRLIAMPFKYVFADLVRYENIFPTKLCHKDLVFESIDKMYAIADHYGLCDDNELPSSVVFAEDDKAYMVRSNSSCLEIEDILPYGLDDAAVMTLYDLKGVDDPYKFFKEAYTTIEGLHKSNMFPLVVMDTKNNKATVINR